MKNKFSYNKFYEFLPFAFLLLSPLVVIPLFVFGNTAAAIISIFLLICGILLSAYLDIREFQTKDISRQNSSKKYNLERATIHNVTWGRMFVYVESTALIKDKEFLFIDRYMKRDLVRKVMPGTVVNLYVNHDNMEEFSFDLTTNR